MVKNKLETEKTKTQVLDELNESAETLEKKVDKLEARFDKYMTEEEHSHDILVKQALQIKALEERLKLLDNKTFLGKAVCWLLFK